MSFIDRSTHRAGRFRVPALVVVGFLCISCSLAPEPPVEPRSPNIILVSFDTLRADHLGCFGYSRDTSPHLDQFASEHVLFERAVAQAPHTHPSHMSLFQSRYPRHLGDTAPILAEILRSNGYRTAGITGGGKVSAKLGFGRGFDSYEEHREGFSRIFPMIEDYLGGMAADSPFFLFIHTYDVHAPYDSPAEFDAFSDPDYDGHVRSDRTREYLMQLTDRLKPDDHFESIDWDDADRQQMVDFYDAGIREIDHYFGLLLELLENQVPGWDWERDILVLFSDHGEEFWEHDSVAHGKTLYQEAIHVPLIMRYPGSGSPGQRIAENVRLMDVSPTLLELAGIEKPQTFMGSSLMSLIESEPGARVARDGASETVGKLSALVTPRWKMIRKGGPEPTFELYDLENDPGELQSISDQPQTTREMAGGLRREFRWLDGAQTEEIPVFVEEQAIEDEELREQLKALGYIGS